MRTREQSERECGARIVTYMMEIGNLMQDTTYNFTTLKHKLDNFMQREWSLGSDEDDHILARSTRITISNLLMTKQTELNSI